MKAAFSLFIFFVLRLCALGQEVYQKDGKILRASNLRRDGGVVFVKLASQGEQPESVMIAVNGIERIALPEDPFSREAAAYAYAGDAASALIKASQALSYARQWSDIEGNNLPDVLKILIPSLIVAGKKGELTKLVESWAPTKDVDLEKVVGLLRLRERGDQRTEFETECKRLIEGSPGNLSAAVAWMFLGRGALEARQWSSAIRAFTSIRLFSQSWRLLQPVALLGGIEACRGSGSAEQASIFISDLETEYPESVQAGIAKRLPPLSSVSP